MATQEPTHDEITAFLGRLKEYRATLPEKDQRLLTTMVVAALGLTEQKKEEAEVTPFWVAYHNPVGPVGGPGYGTAVATPYGGAAWGGSPWGTAYRVW